MSKNIIIDNNNNDDRTTGTGILFAGIRSSFLLCFLLSNLLSYQHRQQTTTATPLRPTALRRRREANRVCSFTRVVSGGVFICTAHRVKLHNPRQGLRYITPRRRCNSLYVLHRRYVYFIFFFFSFPFIECKRRPCPPHLYRLIGEPTFQLD